MPQGVDVGDPSKWQTALMYQGVAGSGAKYSKRLWQLLEVIHWPAYRPAESNDGYRSFGSIGLEDFWMGYFASRAYPLGQVPAEVVTATFFTFHPDMVRRALPEAWRIATVEQVAEAKLQGADASLRRMLGDRVRSVELSEAADLAAEAVKGCGLAGRPLFAAYAALPWPPEPHLRLWHAATVLREHRADGHTAASLSHGLDGLAAHVTNVASGAVPREMGQRSRGWSDEEWAACERRLTERGWLADGQLTADGRAVRNQVEAVTDQLAAEPWDHLGDERTDRFFKLTLPIARTLFDEGVLSVPNTIGVDWPYTA